MRNFKWLIVGALSAIGLTACQFGTDEELRIVSWTEGRERVRSVSAWKLGRALAQSVRRLDRMAASAFESAEEKDWYLRRVTLGLEIEAEAELADIVELAGEGALELRYEALPQGGVR